MMSEKSFEDFSQCLLRMDPRRLLFPTILRQRDKQSRTRGIRPVGNDPNGGGAVSVHERIQKSFEDFSQCLLRMDPRRLLFLMSLRQRGKQPHTRGMRPVGNDPNGGETVSVHDRIRGTQTRKSVKESTDPKTAQWWIHPTRWRVICNVAGHFKTPCTW